LDARVFGIAQDLLENLTLVIPFGVAAFAVVVAQIVELLVVLSIFLGLVVFEE
jgi:hypothetical protein